MKQVEGQIYKLFYFYEDGAYELYNLTSDDALFPGALDSFIGEQDNLLAGSPSAEIQTLARQMNTEMRNWLIRHNAATGTWRGNGNTVGLPPADMVMNDGPASESLFVLADELEATKDDDKNPINPYYGTLPGGSAEIVPPNTHRITRNYSYDSADIPELGTNGTVSFDIIFSMTPKEGTFTNAANQGVGVDDGSSDSSPKLDDDNGIGGQESIRFHDVVLTNVIVSSSEYPDAVVQNVRFTGLRPAAPSSLTVTISGDDQLSTTADNVSQSPGNNNWITSIFDFNEMSVFAESGSMNLKGVEIKVDIVLDPFGSADYELQLYDWQPHFLNGRIDWMTWKSSTAKTYDIEATPDLTDPFTPLPDYTGIAGMPGGYTTVLDLELTGAAYETNGFLRIREN